MDEKERKKIVKFINRSISDSIHIKKEKRRKTNRMSADNDDFLMNFSSFLGVCLCVCVFVKWTFPVCFIAAKKKEKTNLFFFSVAFQDFQRKKMIDFSSKQNKKKIIANSCWHFVFVFVSTIEPPEKQK